MDNLSSFLNPDELRWERDENGEWSAVGFKPKAKKKKTKLTLPLRATIAVLLTLAVLSGSMGGIKNVFHWIATGEIRENQAP